MGKRLGTPPTAIAQVRAQRNLLRALASLMQEYVRQPMDQARVETLTASKDELQTLELGRGIKVRLFVQQASAAALWTPVNGLFTCLFAFPALR